MYTETFRINRFGPVGSRTDNQNIHGWSGLKDILFEALCIGMYSLGGISG